MMERGRSWGGSLGMGRGLSPGHPTPLFHHGSSTGKEWSDKKNQNRTDKPKLKKKNHYFVSKATIPVSGQPEPLVQAHVQSSRD